MPDRELLEAAAKAAGLVAHRYCEPWKAMAKYTLYDGYFGPSWNPLTDDGDALRLAVMLRIDIHFEWNGEAMGDIVEAMSPDRGDGSRWCMDQSTASDPNAATRRAIVRAAAAMHASPKTGGTKS
jgi:hypothetical protein